MCEKKRFSKREAIGALNYNKKRNVNRRFDRRFRREVRYYHCPECNYWHLTSKKDNEGSKKEREVNLIEKERWEKKKKNNNCGCDND